MPKIRFNDLPRGLWQHIVQRAEQRQIPRVDLLRLQEWVRSQPSGPEGDWYKDFGSFKLCNTGEFPKTFLTKSMKPYGDRIE